jgi:hypothetical protein
MNVRVIKEDAHLWSHLTGGEYAEHNLEIHVDEALPYFMQRDLIIHSILENYFPSLEHRKIEQLETIISDALGQLDEDVKAEVSP